LTAFNNKKLPVTAGLHKSETFQVYLSFGENLKVFKDLAYTRTAKFSKELIESLLLTSEMSHLFFLAEMWIIAMGAYVAYKRKYRMICLIMWTILLYFTASAVVYMGGVITESFMISDLCQRMYNLNLYAHHTVTQDPSRPTKIWNPLVFDMSVDLTLGNYMFCYDNEFQNLVGKQYMAHSEVELALLKHSRIDIRAYNKKANKIVFVEPTNVKELYA